MAFLWTFFFTIGVFLAPVQCQGCTFTLSQPNGAFTSPGFPQNYTDNTFCDWTIEADPNQVIELSFSEFELEDAYDCGYDSLEIYDGSGTHHPLLGKYCGTTLPNTTRSTGNTMYVVFRTDGSQTYTGFFASYQSQVDYSETTDWWWTDTTLKKTPTTRPWTSTSTRQTTEWWGTATVYHFSLSQPSGKFSSPGFPQDYENNIVCSWTIETDPNHVISLSFHEFHLESVNDCRYDYVEIYDGSGPHSPLLGKYCGTGLPNTIRSTGSMMYVVFRTDGSETYQGFSAFYQSQAPATTSTSTRQTTDWRTTTKATDCGVTLLSQSTGTFTSPGFPQHYENNIHCSWLIVTDRYHVISLSFNEFYLESSSNCGYDSVEIYDGSGPHYPLLGRYCGNYKPNTIRSTGSMMYVVFSTDGSDTYKGFSAYYQSYVFFTTRSTAPTTQTTTKTTPTTRSTTSTTIESRSSTLLNTATTVDPLIRFNYAYTRVRVECALIDREKDCSDVQNDLDYMVGRGFDEACNYLDTYTLCVTLRCEDTFPFREALHDLQDVCTDSTTAKPPMESTVDPFARYDFFTKYTDLRHACTLTDSSDDCSSEQADLDYKITHGWQETCDELPIYTLCMVLKCETSLHFRDALDGVHKMCDSTV